jgi:hypothetical protein
MLNSKNTGKARKHTTTQLSSEIQEDEDKIIFHKNIQETTYYDKSHSDAMDEA